MPLGVGTPAVEKQYPDDPNPAEGKGFGDFLRGWSGADQPTRYPGACRWITIVVHTLNPVGLANCNPLSGKQLPMLARLRLQHARRKLIAFWRAPQVPSRFRPAIEGRSGERHILSGSAWWGSLRCCGKRLPASKASLVLAWYGVR